MYGDGLKHAPAGCSRGAVGRTTAVLTLLAATFFGPCTERAWAQSASIDGITGPASVLEPFRSDDYVNSDEANDFTVHGSASGLATVKLACCNMEYTATVTNGKWQVSGLGLIDSQYTSLIFEGVAVWTDGSGNQGLDYQTFDVKLSDTRVTYDAPSITAGRTVSLAPSVDASGEAPHVWDSSHPDVYPYSVKSGRLPDGLALDRVTGVIRGAPGTATVCSADRTTGALTLLSAGQCAVVATAAETADSLPGATARFRFEVKESQHHLGVAPAGSPPGATSAPRPRWTGAPFSSGSRSPTTWAIPRPTPTHMATAYRLPPRSMTWANPTAR